MFDTVLAFDYIDGARDNNTHRNTNPNQNQAAFDPKQTMVKLVL